MALKQAQIQTRNTGTQKLNLHIPPKQWMGLINAFGIWGTRRSPEQTKDPK